MFSIIRPAFSLLLLLTLIGGLIYPLIVTGVSQVVFPFEANGSLVVKDGKVLGSQLIGQPFTDPAYFWSRSSATSPMPYNAQSSGGSNLGPSNPALIDGIKQRIEALKKADPANTKTVPVDLVTSSASGLDPHISLAAAYYQVDRIAAARKLSPARVRLLVDQHRELPSAYIIGEPMVNVLMLNLALRDMKDLAS